MVKFTLVLSGLLVTLTAAASQPSYQVISDVDDTLKYANIQNKLAAGWNGLFTSKEFAGSSEYMQAVVDAQAKVNFVSSTPEWLRGKINRFIKKHGFPDTRVFLKKKMSDDTYTYKTAKVAEVAGEGSEPLVLIGDDVEVDAEAFTDFAKQNPSRVAAVYIRRVRNRALPSGAIPFTTFFEVALREYLAGRIELDGLASVASAVLQAKHKLVVPRFGSCASPQSALATDDLTRTLESMVNDRVVQVCRDHKHRN
ncbi:MAG: DUF2183 domain-containing protein [Bdellovibrionales bacterium]|nr:DUF2183 domain-containing protein [Bdellovibrionales bacterium]